MTDPNQIAELRGHEQMVDAQTGCLPCKLCGGSAIISDAGLGAGYYIRCSNSVSFRSHRGCMIDERRLGGWAYNVRDWWNRLHAAPALLDAAERVGRLEEALGDIFGHYSDRDQAPGHSHDAPGIWDDDNAPGVAGTSCDWCAKWERARALLAEPASGGDADGLC